MATTLTFDVYGTLINTEGISGLVKTFVGDKAISFMDSWRAKQLEYTFRRGLMKNYVGFSECTRNALDFTCELLKCNLQPEERNRLMREYKVLPAFTDVRESLEKLKSADLRLFAFSNGSAADVTGLLENAGILHFFEDVVSVDDVKTYKPNPEVYAYFLQKSKSAKTNAWLISSNPFDVIGAVSAGMRSVWVQRNPAAIFDTWGIEPTKTIDGLQDLATSFSE
jgi:2-haloacid dehalogenase